MERDWDTGQLALFEALGEIVEKVGSDGARELANTISQKPTAAFLARLRQLEEDSALVGELKKFLEPSDQPQWTPEQVREKLQVLSCSASVLKEIFAWPIDDLKNCINLIREAVGLPKYPGNSAGTYEAGPEDAAAQQSDAGSEKEAEGEMEEYKKKANAKLKKVVDANKTLQARLRVLSDNRNRWSRYADQLERRLERSYNLLMENGISIASPRVDRTAETAEARERPRTLERDGDREVAAQGVEGKSFNDLPVISRRIMAQKKRSQENAQAALLAGRSAEPSEHSESESECVPANRTPESERMEADEAYGIRRFKSISEAEKERSQALNCDGSPPGTSASANSRQSASQEEPTSPKLPKLIHATTVPDSLASSSSFSVHHTSSTQASHPTSGADTINAAEANGAAATAYPLSDSEPPVVVSSRQLRKRKPTGSSPVKKRIKQERLESSPIALLGLRHLMTQESMDLDEIGVKTATPKKRREKRDVQEYVVANDDDRVYQNAPNFMAGDGAREETPGSPVERPSLPNTPVVAGGVTSVLKPKSTNTTILPRTSAKTYSAKRRRVEDNVKGAQLFSEDGENHLAATDADAVESTSRVLPRARATRLEDLMERPSPRRWQVMNMDDQPDLDDNAVVEKRQTVDQRRSAQREVGKGLPQPGLKAEDSEDDLPDMAELMRSGQGPKNRESPHSRLDAPFKTLISAHKPTVISKGRRVREDVPSTARPEEEPLASRPVSRLSLDDFRINPEYNNGLDYAYRDVVRGREKRKCLSGCTDPTCCGKGFRALADIATPTREKLTDSEEAEQTRLLHDFLGPEASRLLRSMNKEERRETVIKARTRELANKHGKHRHAYERRKSPPGFWRTDFPTTQEEAEDREKAKVFERDLVQKRYEEAMRGGGKWIFKDQKGGQPEWIGRD